MYFAKLLCKKGVPYFIVNLLPSKGVKETGKEEALFWKILIIMKIQTISQEHGIECV